MNKREFLVGTAALAAAAAEAIVQPTEAVGCTLPDATPLPDLAQDASLRAWRAHLHRRFGLAGSRVALVLERIDVREFDAHAEQFSLLFAAVGQAPAAGTTTLRDAAGRGVDVHLQAAGVDGNGQLRLRADFNRLV